MRPIAKIIKTASLITVLAISAFADSSRGQEAWDFDSLAAVPAAPSANYLAAKEVNTMLDQMAERWNAKDLEGYLSFYWHSPELVFVEDGILMSGWDEVAGKYRRGFHDVSAMGHATMLRVHVRMLGPDTAYAVGQWTMVFAKTTVVGTDSAYIGRISGRWVIMFAHTSTIEM
jgi:uncharacterized protein (TIGR02246 family)